MSEWIVYAGLAVAAFFALLLLYRGLFPRRDLIEDRAPHRRLSWWFWALFQFIGVGVALYLNAESEQPVSPQAAIIVGAAIAFFVTFVCVTVYDWTMRLLRR